MTCARLCASTLAPVLTVAAAGVAAATALGAWWARAEQGAEIRTLHQQLHAEQARAAAIETVARALMTHPPEQHGTPVTTATGPQTTQDRARPAGPAHTNPMPTRPAQVAPLRESRQVASAVTPASAPRPVADVVRLAVPPERPTATEAAADVAASPGAGLAMKPEAMPVAAAGAPRSAVVPKDRIELFSAERLGVDRIEAGAVVMRSGRRVRVGETFDSGEVLREADPTRGRIVTDQRNIALL